MLNKTKFMLAAALVAYLSYGSIVSYFREYVPQDRMGGVNTHLANALVDYLRKQPAGTRVWFLAPPRMGYKGFELLDFLARHVDGKDVIDPITELAGVPPALRLASPEQPPNRPCLIGLRACRAARCACVDQACLRHA